LVDGMALVYRAFYAMIRRPLRDAEGRNTSAIFGFAQVMLSLLEKEKPTHWAVVFDTAAPTFRHEQYAEYKIHRPAMPEEMVPQLWGVGPEHIVDVLALMGDSSDNVPGVRGIGEKTAVKLMSEYGSLDALYERLEDLTPPSTREKLRAGREEAYASRMLVTLD